MFLSRRGFVGLMAGVGSLMQSEDRTQASAPQTKTSPSERVTLDAEGVVRWRADNREVALFGANYCLPSACDYRAAGYVGADRKKLIEEDMAHFARMGWDALRLSFWGDWENCDAQGNLIVNDHLDLLDYLIAQATARGVYMLFSPIVTYSSLWPENRNDSAVVGLSRHFQKGELGTNPEAIAAQVNYLQQLLRHVNPYTGQALKDEPNILFIEMINEPWHHSNDFEGSVRYIDALVDAVRSTGCAKLLFHNVSQDFGMAKAIRASKAQGSTFGWYPSGLDMRGELHGNFLKYVEDYPQMRLPELDGKAKVVYEFDLPDVMSGYHYPAMARTFRAGGIQFAAMFSYDMLATAPFNLGWQLHCLNMVYTPQKAVSAIIAGEVMRNLPRLGFYGAYPKNTRFGDFRVSYEENLSEMRSRTAFLYSNDTPSAPVSLTSLRKIVGYGSSPVVAYKGKGLYFLDRIEEGIWRLEVYPDSITLVDPFGPPRKDRTVFRLVARTWPMQIHLPDLGASFRVEPLNEGNTHTATAQDGQFSITPGVFLLTAAEKAAPRALPEKVDRVGLREFVCPAANSVSPTAQGDAGGKRAVAVAPPSPLRLFDPEQDRMRLDLSRAIEGRPGSARTPVEHPNGKKAFRLLLPSAARYRPDDVTASLYIGDRIAAQGDHAGNAKALAVTLKSTSERARVHLTLVEMDGTAWGAPLEATSEVQTLMLPLSKLVPVSWVLLPQGFPGDGAYFAPSTRRSGAINLRNVERLQLSLRKADLPDNAANAAVGVEIESVTVAF